MVEPVNPGRSCLLNLTPVTPDPVLATNNLSLKQTDRRLHQSVIQRISNCPNRSRDPGIDERLRERQRRVLGSCIRMVQQPISSELKPRPASREQRLLQR